MAKLPKYKPGRFSDLSEEPITGKLWAFLHEHDNLIRMETASEMGRPAVEALVGRLIDRFGEDVHRDRVKKMIGHMVRQVMWSRRFTHYRHGCRVRVGKLFTRASRYIDMDRPPEDMDE